MNIVIVAWSKTQDMNTGQGARTRTRTRTHQGSSGPRGFQLQLRRIFGDGMLARDQKK